MSWSNKYFVGLLAVAMLAVVPARADECGVNMFNPKLLLQADFTDAGNNQYKGKWNGHLDRYVEKYPFGFVSGERYKITYKLDCGDPKVANQYLTFVKSDNTTVKINRQACINGNGTVEIISPEGAKIVGLKVETFSANELESGEPYNGEILISNLMVTKADVDTSRFISYNPCTRVATQTMLENSSYGMRDRLNYVANVITDLITQSKTNTRNIDTLSQNKQTRPAEGCPAGYDTCLLVKDTNGKNVWYPIETCNLVSSLVNLGEFAMGGENHDGSQGKACDGRYSGIGPSTDNACQLNEWANVYHNAAVYGVARAVSIAENTRGAIVTLPNNVQSGEVCVCRATAYTPVESWNSDNQFQSTFGSRTPINTDKWFVSGSVVPNPTTGEMPSDYDDYCITSCGFNAPDINEYFANIANACSDAAPTANMCALDPWFASIYNAAATSGEEGWYQVGDGYQICQLPSAGNTNITPLENDWCFNTTGTIEDSWRLGQEVFNNSWIVRYPSVTATNEQIAAGAANVPELYGRAYCVDITPPEVGTVLEASQVDNYRVLDPGEGTAPSYPCLCKLAAGGDSSSGAFPHTGNGKYIYVGPSGGKCYSQCQRLCANYFLSHSANALIRELAGTCPMSND